MIKVEDVSKYYSAKRALGPVSFEIQDGETVGFLGLNGAGKTTALRILACDLRASSGSVKVGHIDAQKDPHSVRQRVGYLPEQPPVYPAMTPWDYVHFCGNLRGMTAPQLAKRVPEVLAVTDTAAVAHQSIGTLSHGYRQRVGLAQAIVHEPELLILDEPTRGLDPVQIVEMRNMIQSLKEAHTILISSHILTEVAKTCDRLLVLGGGEILAAGSQSDLSDRAGKVRLEITVALKDRTAADAEATAKSLAPIQEVTSSQQDGECTLRVLSTEDVRAELCRKLVSDNWDVLRLDRSRSELENIFLNLVQGAAQPEPVGGDDANN